MLTTLLQAQLALTVTLTFAVNAWQEKTKVPNKADQPSVESDKTPGVPILAEEEKSRQKALKLEQNQYERELRRQYQQPAEVQIRASLENVRELLINAMVGKKFKLGENSKDRVMFWQPTNVVLHMAGRPSQTQQGFHVITVKLSNKEQMTRLEFDLQLTYESPVGGYTKLDKNKDLTLRKWLSYVLLDLKEDAEKP